MNIKTTLLAVSTLFLLVAAGCNQPQGVTPTNTTTSTLTPTSTAPAAATPSPTPSAPPIVSSVLSSPLDRAGGRITKKFYGAYVTPKSSPVSPERFTGYHTGLDFETFPEEQNSDVAVHALCTGPLLLKRTASGYGGVAVQKCTVSGEVVTVVYGHMRLASIAMAVGQELKAGDALGVLGTGYSKETDGERKHLHLSIHKGSAVTLAGYVQNKSALTAWLDPKGELGL